MDSAGALAPDWTLTHVCGLFQPLDMLYSVFLTARSLAFLSLMDARRLHTDHKNVLLYILQIYYRTQIVQTDWRYNCLKTNAQRKSELNWTDWCSVKFSFPLCFGLKAIISSVWPNNLFPAAMIRDNSATKLATVTGSSRSGHTVVNRPINAVSVVGRKPATSCDDWWRPSLADAGSLLSGTCDGRCRWSQLVADSEKLNWTQLNCFPLCIGL